MPVSSKESRRRGRSGRGTILAKAGVAPSSTSGHSMLAWFQVRSTRHTETHPVSPFGRPSPPRVPLPVAIVEEDDRDGHYMLLAQIRALEVWRWQDPRQLHQGEGV
jgi:hypothetical protein